MRYESTLKDNIEAALGKVEADLVIKNARVLNVFTESFEYADIAVKNGIIVGLGSYSGKTEVNADGKAVVPGFIDGHVHIESSALSPTQFCKAVAAHGTTAVVADPHEITNVLGKMGFYYILEDSKGLPVDVYLMVPSCVPATPFDESGAKITHDDIEEMLNSPRVIGLAEMMNFPGVLAGSDEVLKKLFAALDTNKAIDGHAPGLSGKELNAYITAGICSDHESTNAKEAIEKLALGQWVMIREGTASKNLASLISLFEKPYCDRSMLVTDDSHPGDLLFNGHIDNAVRKAISLGADPIIAYKMSSYNAARYFGLRKNGAIAPGYAADFVILNDIEKVDINSVYKRGKRIDDIINEPAEKDSLSDYYIQKVTNTVNVSHISADSFKLKKAREKVIGLVPGEITKTDEGYATDVDIENDICKLAVVERHHATGNIGVAFVKGYGLKAGAVATSISHDSHNIIVVGTNDNDMAYAVERLKAMQGGMVVVNNGKTLSELALPIGGLMCNMTAEECANRLSDVKYAAYSLGVNADIDPFMTLSFASLAVIPEICLTTKGVVDVLEFKLI